MIIYQTPVSYSYGDNSIISVADKNGMPVAYVMDEPFELICEWCAETLDNAVCSAPIPQDKWHTSMVMTVTFNDDYDLTLFKLRFGGAS